jgi:hypothetical protein
MLIYFILLFLVQGRYQRTWDYCCGLGMTPVMFETVAEQTCFGAMVNSKKRFYLESQLNKYMSRNVALQP